MFRLIIKRIKNWRFSFQQSWDFFHQKVKRIAQIFSKIIFYILQRLKKLLFIWVNFPFDLFRHIQIHSIIFFKKCRSINPSKIMLRVKNIIRKFFSYIFLRLKMLIMMWVDFPFNIYRNIQTNTAVIVNASQKMIEKNFSRIKYFILKNLHSIQNARTRYLRKEIFPKFLFYRITFPHMHFVNLRHLAHFFLKLIIGGGLILYFSFEVAADTMSAKEFPAKLPEPTLQETSINTEGHTPEYVVIKPSDQVTFSSETAASVAEILVREGSSFNQGDVLLRLDCRLHQAELDKALAQQTAAHKASTSARKLKSFGSISEFEVVKADSDDKIANAEVEKLKAIVDKCVIRAPFKGAVAELMVHAHESVKPGDPLLKIISTENLEFEIQIPSLWLKWLKVGSIFYVNLNDINKTVSARITKINPQIEPVSQSVKITGVILTTDTQLLPGMSGQAIFPDNPSQLNTKKIGKP